jgi:hypothetical protein
MLTFFATWLLFDVLFVVLWSKRWIRAVSRG